MRDNRYTNMWGEDEEEQKKRREWLSQVYDNAIIPDTDIQTPLNQDNKFELEQTSILESDNSFGQTPYQTGANQLPKDVEQRISEYEQKYQGQNQVLSGLKSMNSKDWGNVALTSVQGAERMLDGATLGLYTPFADKVLGLDYSGRKNKYHQEAEQAGIGDFTKLVDSAIEEGSSNVGAGKIVSKLTTPFKVSKPTKVLMDSSVGSGITEVNRNGSWRDPDEDFRKGANNSFYIQLMQYLNRLL